MSDLLADPVSEGEMLDYEPDNFHTPPASLAKPPSLPQTPRKAKPKRRVRSLQVFHHRFGIGVLCIRDQSFCLTNGTVSHVVERDPRMLSQLRTKLYDLHVRKLYVTDNATRIRWRAVTKHLGYNDPLYTLPVVTLKRRESRCSKCKKDCVRYGAMDGLECLTRVKVDQIPH